MFSFHVAGERIFQWSLGTIGGSAYVLHSKGPAGQMLALSDLQRETVTAAVASSPSSWESYVWPTVSALGRQRSP
jgi:hypothetical protein